MFTKFDIAYDVQHVAQFMNQLQSFILSLQELHDLKGAFVRFLVSFLSDLPVLKLLKLILVPTRLVVPILSVFFLVPI